MNKKISICVVEDYFLKHAEYQRGFKGIDDFEIHGVKNAEECLDALNSDENRFNVVLMDLILTGINGITATRMIKEKYKNVKVIIYTVRDTEEIVLACASSGADGYIVKDDNITYKSLADIIMAVNCGGMWFDERVSHIIKSMIPKPVSTENFNNLYGAGGIIGSRNYIKSVLTQRELEALMLMSEGKSNTEIAKIMMVSVNTAKAHVGNVLSKLSVEDRVQAAVKAVKARLV